MATKTLVPQTVTHSRVIVRTDNLGTKWALSTGRTRDSVLGACAREIWLISALQGLDIMIVHVPGESLVLADALSRASFDPSMKKLAGTLVCKRNVKRVTPVPFNNVLTMSV